MRILKWSLACAALGAAAARSVVESLAPGESTPEAKQSDYVIGGAMGGMAGAFLGIAAGLLRKRRSAR